MYEAEVEFFFTKKGLKSLDTVSLNEKHCRSNVSLISSNFYLDLNHLVGKMAKEKK